MLRELKDEDHPSKKNDMKITQEICNVITHNTNIVIEKEMVWPKEFRAIA